MLWRGTNKTFGRDLVIAADSPAQAAARILRITQVGLNWDVWEHSIDSPECEDDAIESVESWWGDFCDYADGNDSISDTQFDEVKEWMNLTFNAIYDSGRGLCELEN